jgi:superfamily II DNA or RNA helicase
MRRTNSAEIKAAANRASQRLITRAMDDPWWFQPRAEDQCMELWSQGANHICLVSPPGSGKTEMTANIIKRKLKPKNPICIVHTLALKENATSRLPCATHTIQSLLSGDVNMDDVDFVVWEECHHTGGPTWPTVMQRFRKKVKLLGLTATPQRSDGKPLSLFKQMVVAAHYSELLMSKTIVPFKVLTPTGWREDADPDPAHAYLTYGEDMKAIIFCSTVQGAEDVAQQLGSKAAPWHSDVSWTDREKSLRLFKQGKLKVLTTVDALTEGVNVPDAQCVVLGRRCHNVSTYLQTTARAGRASPGKKYALLIDLKGASLRHGPPTIDREYSITGTGISRRGGQSGPKWYIPRGPREPKNLGIYNAELHVSFDWHSPNMSDKRRQMGWLIQQAGRRGWGPDVATQVFTTMFGHPPEDAGISPAKVAKAVQKMEPIEGEAAAQ